MILPSAGLLGTSGLALSGPTATRSEGHRGHAQVGVAVEAAFFRKEE